MSDLKITIDEIKELMDKMAKTGMTKMEVEDGDFKLSLSKKAQKIVRTSMVSEDISPAIMGGAEAPTASYATDVVEAADGNVITAPIVGTYYNAPSPDKAPFVKVGQTVKKGDVLFIIESMKLMNEIQSEFDGEVTDVMIKTGSPVEFGQPVLTIR